MSDFEVCPECLGECQIVVCMHKDGMERNRQMKLEYQVCDTERCTDQNLRKLFVEEDNRYLCRNGSDLFVSSLFCDEGGFGFYVDNVAQKQAVHFDELDELWLIGRDN